MFHKLSNNCLECFIFIETNLKEENSFGNKTKVYYAMQAKSKSKHF